MPDTPRRDDTAFNQVLKAIEAGHINLYRNVLNEPYVYCDHPKYPSLNLHLFERDFRAWLVHFVRRESGILLTLRKPAASLPS